MIKVGQKAKILQDVLSPSSEHVFKAGDIVEFIREENRLGIDFYLFYIPDKSAQYYITKQVFEVFEVPGLDNTIKDTEMKFNLEGHLEEVLAGRLVKLRNGKKAKIVADLRADSNNQIPFNSIYGHCLVGFFNDETSMVSIWDLNGRNNPDVSEDDMWDIIGLVDVVEFPENMWDIIDPKWNYMAIDEDGESWFYIVEPAISEGGCCWDSSANDCAKNELIKVSTTDWTKSLIKRPGI